MHVLYCTVLYCTETESKPADNHVMYPRRQARTWCVLQTAETKMFLQKKKAPHRGKVLTLWYILRDRCSSNFFRESRKGSQFRRNFHEFRVVWRLKNAISVKNSDKTDELMYPYITLISINKTTWETSTQSAASSIFWSSRLGFDPSWYPFCIFRLFFSLDDMWVHHRAGKELEPAHANGSKTTLLPWMWIFARYQYQ